MTELHFVSVAKVTEQVGGIWSLYGRLLGHDIAFSGPYCKIRIGHVRRCKPIINRNSNKTKWVVDRWHISLN